jgi:hypothetical protein
LFVFCMLAVISMASFLSCDGDLCDKQPRCACHSRLRTLTSGIGLRDAFDPRQRVR